MKHKLRMCKKTDPQPEGITNATSFKCKHGGRLVQNRPRAFFKPGRSWYHLSLERRRHEPNGKLLRWLRNENKDQEPEERVLMILVAWHRCISPLPIKGSGFGSLPIWGLVHDFLPHLNNFAVTCFTLLTYLYLTLLLPFNTILYIQDHSRSFKDFKVLC